MDLNVILKDIHGNSWSIYFDDITGITFGDIINKFCSENPHYESVKLIYNGKILVPSQKILESGVGSGVGIVRNDDGNILTLVLHGKINIKKDECININTTDEHQGQSSTEPYFSSDSVYEPENENEFPENESPDHDPDFPTTLPPPPKVPAFFTSLKNSENANIVNTGPEILSTIYQNPMKMIDVIQLFAYNDPFFLTNIIVNPDEVKNFLMDKLSDPDSLFQVRNNNPYEIDKANVKKILNQLELDESLFEEVKNYYLFNDRDIEKTIEELINIFRD